MQLLSVDRPNATYPEDGMPVHGCDLGNEQLSQKGHVYLLIHVEVVETYTNAFQ